MPVERNNPDRGKVDLLPTNGLTGTADSLAYRVEELEVHFHSWERWFETAAVPVGGSHVADRIGTGAGAFRMDAGNNTWGTWIQVLGDSDTPADAGNAKYDPHRIEIEATERFSTYFLQFGFGGSGASAITNGFYSEMAFTPLSAVGQSVAIDLAVPRWSAGTKMWARCMCPGQNTAWIDFYIGIHEYEG